MIGTGSGAQVSDLLHSMMGNQSTDYWLTCNYCCQMKVPLLVHIIVVCVSD